MNTYSTSPGGEKWQPTPVPLPEKSHGQKSLADYSPKSCKESDTTEKLSTQYTKNITQKTLKSIYKSGALTLLPNTICSRINCKVNYTGNGTSLLVQWLKLRAPNAGGLGSNPGQGTRFHMLQLRPSATKYKNPLEYF